MPHRLFRRPLSNSANDPTLLAPYNISAEVLIAGQQIVQARWFDLWAGAVAVDVMCLRIAKAGIFHLKDGLGIMINRAGTDATASS